MLLAGWERGGELGGGGGELSSLVGGGFESWGLGAGFEPGIVRSLLVVRTRSNALSSLSALRPP